MRALYLSHPQVRIDPEVPVPQWGLSVTGRERAEAFAARDLIAEGRIVFASDERKAVELAEIIMDAIVITDPALGENDRSATGFLPPEKFEATADRFFAEPMMSVDGWERAIDAQRRIVEAVGRAMTEVQPGQIAVFCGHGASGDAAQMPSGAMGHCPLGRPGADGRSGRRQRLRIRPRGAQALL